MSHQYTSEISAVKDWLSRVPMPQRTAHRAITLIIRLDAEIERLYKSLNLTAREQYTNGRNDGIREFAQLVKEHLDDFYHTDDGSLLDTVSMVDLLVKEMTEDQSNDPKEIH